MNKKLVTVEFEDQGQDFLEWDIEFDEWYSLGIVKDSRPFAQIWVGYCILSGQPRVNEHLSISKDSSSIVLNLKYPIIKVTEHENI